ncbi:MAG: hypothetical protein ACPGPF_07890 [Pontibacterium sp.]
MSSPIWAALAEWTPDAELNSLKTSLIQAAFEVLGNGELVFQGEQRDLALQHYTRCVAEDPSFLKGHVQRIYAATAAENKAELEGAIIDLMWFLDKGGEPLKVRVFQQVAPLLAKRSRVRLAKALHKNDRALLLEMPLEKTMLVNGPFSDIM